jgi:hypothetical protein
VAIDEMMLRFNHPYEDEFPLERFESYSSDDEETYTNL